MRDEFQTYHIGIRLFYYLVAIGGSLFIAHPVVQVISVLAALLYYGRNHKQGCRKLISYGMVFMIGLSIGNPLWNTRGNTILFCYANGRAFTLEALLYGCNSAMLCFGIVLWFACLHYSLTEGGDFRLPGMNFPHVRLLFGMILQMIPALGREKSRMEQGRKGIGMYQTEEAFRTRLRQSSAILSALASWSLEGAIVTGDSMRSRGYASGVSSRYQAHAWHRTDTVMMGCLLGLLIMTVVGVAAGMGRVTFYPAVVLPKWNQWTGTGMIGYSVFICMPMLIQIREGIIWRNLKSDN